MLSATAARLALGWAMLSCAFLLIQSSQPQQSAPYILTPDNVTLLEQGKWFVKFYAPWCGHCQRLVPTWNDVAEALHATSDIRVAKFDCTVDKELCRKFGVRGYPTLQVFVDSDPVTFSGPRRKDDLIAFALKASSNPIETLTSPDKIKQAIDAETPFVLLVEKSEASEKQQKKLGRSLLRAARELSDSLSFYKVDRSALGPEVAGDVFIYRDGLVVPFDSATADVNDLVEWVKINRWPVFPHLDAKSGSAIMAEVPGVVLAIVLLPSDYERSDLVLRTVETAARESTVPKQKLQYCYMDSEGMARYMREIWDLGEDDLPRLVLHNQSNARVYVSPPDLLLGSPETDAVESFVQDCLDGKIQGTDANSFFQQLRRMFYRLIYSLQAFYEEAPIVSLTIWGLIVVAFIFMLVVCCCMDGEDEDIDDSVRRVKQQLEQASQDSGKNDSKDDEQPVEDKKRK